MVFGRGRDQAEAKVDEEMHGLVTQLTNEITFHMRECGLSRAELATRMGVSPGRISQILGGGENLTLRTLAALATALDARFDFELSSLRPRTSSPAAAGPTPRPPRTTTRSRGPSTRRAPRLVIRAPALGPPSSRAGDGCRLWAAEAGHGTPLLLCHGGPGLRHRARLGLARAVRAGDDRPAGAVPGEKALPRVTRAILPRAGHMPWLEEPEELQCTCSPSCEPRSLRCSHAVDRTRAGTAADHAGRRRGRRRRARGLKLNHPEAVAILTRSCSRAPATGAPWPS